MAAGLHSHFNQLGNVKRNFSNSSGELELEGKAPCVLNGTSRRPERLQEFIKSVVIALAANEHVCQKTGIIK